MDTNNLPLKEYIENNTKLELENWVTRTQELKRQHVPNTNPFICADIIGVISKFLSFSCIIQYVVCVCKVWNEFGLSRLKKVTIDFTTKNHDDDVVSFQIWKRFFRKYVMELCRNVEEICIKSDILYMSYFGNSFLEELITKKNLKSVKLIGCDMITCNLGLMKLITLCTNKLNPKIEKLYLEGMNLMLEDNGVIKNMEMLKLKELTILKCKNKILTPPTNVKCFQIDQVDWIKKAITEKIVYHVRELKISYGGDVLLLNLVNLNAQRNSQFAISGNNFVNLYKLEIEHAGLLPSEFPPSLRHLKIKVLVDPEFCISYEPLKSVIKNNRLQIIEYENYFNNLLVFDKETNFTKDMMKLFEQSVYIESIRLWKYPLSSINREKNNCEYIYYKMMEEKFPQLYQNEPNFLDEEIEKKLTPNNPTDEKVENLSLYKKMCKIL